MGCASRPSITLQYLGYSHPVKVRDRLDTWHKPVVVGLFTLAFSAHVTILVISVERAIEPTKLISSNNLLEPGQLPPFVIGILAISTECTHIFPSVSSSLPREEKLPNGNNQNR